MFSNFENFKQFYDIGISTDFPYHMFPPNYYRGENDLNEIDNFFYDKSLNDYENENISYYNIDILYNNNNRPNIILSDKGKEKVVNKNSKITTNNNTIPSDIKNNERKYKNTSKMGRKRKREKGEDINDVNNGNESSHDKYWHDNLRLKFKRHFIRYLILFINDLISVSPYLTKKEKKEKIYKIDSVYVNTTKKDDNKSMLNLTAGQFLSREICEKCHSLNKNNNIKIINHIYETDDKRLKEVLGKTMRELMKIFCSNEIENNIYKDFKRLKNFVEDILINKENENENYIKSFIFQGEHFEDEYDKIKGRKLKGEEKIDIIIEISK